MRWRKGRPYSLKNLWLMANEQLQSDHDLLIRLDTKMDMLTQETKQTHRSIFDRLTDVERDKLDFSEFKLFLERFDEERKKSDGRISRDDFDKFLARYNLDQKRIDFVERLVYIAMGAVGLFQLFGVPLILKFIL